MQVFSHYQDHNKYRLHDFVVMPKNHFHTLLTPIPPTVTISKKPSSSSKVASDSEAKRELGFLGKIWQTSFYDRRVRDASEYSSFSRLLHMNPVRRGLVSKPTTSFPTVPLSLSLTKYRTGQG